MKAAMIGAGSFAAAHLAYLGTRSDIEIVGHVSSRPESREAAATRWGGRGFASCEELLDRTEVEVAWVTVPPHAHGEIEACLIERSVPFFVEKPLSADRLTAERIGMMLAEKDVIVGVGYHWRAMDTLPEVVRALAARPARLVLAAWHGSTPAPGWWRRQATSGGQMVEQATHLVDIARRLVGEATVVSSSANYQPHSAYPDMDVATTSSAVLQFDTGATGVFTATCLLDGVAEVYLKLVCEGLLITLTREGVTFEEGREKRFLRLGESPLAREDAAFIEAVRSGERGLLYSSYADALKTHHLCFDVLESSLRGKG